MKLAKAHYITSLGRFHSFDKCELSCISQSLNKDLLVVIVDVAKLLV